MHDHSECKFRIPVSPGVGMKCPESVFYITTIIVRHSTRTGRSLSTGLSTLGRYCRRFWEGRGNFLDLSPTTHHHRLVLRTRGTGTETGTITTRGRGRGRGRTGRLNCMGSPAPQTSGSFLPSRFPSRSSSRCAVLVSQHSRDACCNTRMQTL